MIAYELEVAVFEYHQSGAQIIVSFIRQFELGEGIRSVDKKHNRNHRCHRDPRCKRWCFADMVSLSCGSG